MATEYTLSILKPDATQANITGKVNSMIEEADLKIVAQKMIKLDRSQAEKFYEIHKDRPFFDALVNFMSSGPIVVQVLKGDNAIAHYREVMGATNPKEASEDTIRYKFSENIDANTVHGSDSPDNAKREIDFFFSPEEIIE